VRSGRPRFGPWVRGVKQGGCRRQRRAGRRHFGRRGHGHRRVKRMRRHSAVRRCDGARRLVRSRRRCRRGDGHHNTSGIGRRHAAGEECRRHGSGCRRDHQGPVGGADGQDGCPSGERGAQHEAKFRAAGTTAACARRGCCAKRRGDGSAAHDPRTMCFVDRPRSDGITSSLQPRAVLARSFASRRQLNLRDRDTERLRLFGDFGRMRESRLDRVGCDRGSRRSTRTAVGRSSAAESIGAGSPRPLCARNSGARRDS
jgi:hypothetical protein